MSRSPLYGFGVSQEDDRVESAVLLPDVGRRVFAITSGGEVPLGLAARGATVDAVDFVAGQNHLAALKLATALALDPTDAARFLGYARAPGPARDRAWSTVRQHLTADAAAFWDAHPSERAAGAIWAGRFERFLIRALRVVRPLWGARNLRALCEAPDLDAQRAIYERRIDRPWVRAAFRIAFSRRAYATRGLDERALAQRTTTESLGDQYLRWLRAFCTATPAADSWFLQVLLGGGLRDPERGPDFLRPEGVAALRAAPERVRLHTAEATDWLREHPRKFDAFHLSNLGDWLDSGGWDGLLEAVVDRAAPGAAAVWRELQTERDVPPGLRDRLRADREAGVALRAIDRFPFYRIIPARVVDGAADRP